MKRIIPHKIYLNYISKLAELSKYDIDSEQYSEIANKTNIQYCNINQFPKNIFSVSTESDNITYDSEVYSVCALFFNKEGKILTVSRRDNYNDKGLVGGKVDEGETPIQALVREVYEETNIKITSDDCFVVYHRTEPNGKLCLCYLVTEFDDSTISQNDGEGLIEYNTWDVLLQGTFSDYNKNLKEYLQL